MKKVIQTILLVVSLSGCAPAMHIYDGPHKNESDLAFIRQNTDEVEVLMIDGMKAPENLPQDFYLLPGKHSLTVKLTYTMYFSPSSVVTKSSRYQKTTCFNVEKGNNYVVLGKPDKNDWELRIEKFNSDDSVNYDCK
jgi:hypothetical protein